jgi:hypothetical protein
MSEAAPVPADIKPTAMQGREQQIGYLLAGFAAVSAIALAALGGGTAAMVQGGVGVVAAAGLALASRHGQRIITSFAALFTGFLLVFLPLELLYLVFSGYLMWRTSQGQAKLAAAKPRLSAQERRQAKAAKSAARGSKTKPGAGDGRDDAAPALPRQPAANRRYTPPKSKSPPRR